MTEPSRRLATFIAASGFTNLADGIAVVVWAWLATLLTRDPIYVALMPVAVRLPWFVFALPAGIVTDRVDRRRLILAMDLLRAAGFVVAVGVLLATLPFANPPLHGISAPGTFAVLLLCALVIGTAEVFRDNAAQTMLPALVPHDRLEVANGRLWSVELIGNALLGPALGAFLIAAAVWLPFAVNAGAYVVAVLLVMQMTGTFRPAQSATRNWRRELGEGLSFLRDAPLLRLLAVITGVWNLLHQMAVIALVLHVQENFGLGARAYGLILAAGAVGGILGGLLADRVVRALGPGRSAQWMTLASAVAFAGVAVAPGGWALAAILAAFEFTGLVWNTVSVSYRQRVIPDALLGRVNSIYRLLAWGMMPVGLLLSGVLVSLADGIVPRGVALVVPFIVAALAAALLTLVAWGPLGRGFTRARG